MANVLDSIMNIIKSDIFSIKDHSNHYHDDNRANNMGRGLEEYVKDSFSGTILCENNDVRKKKQDKVFDYTGNNSNPPDAILHGDGLNGGDAIEIKKRESSSSLAPDLPLNSSYPLQKIYKDSNMINKQCKNISGWKEKDLLYVVGLIDKDSDKKNIKYIFMIYGLDYAAKNKIYSDIKNNLKSSINNIPSFNFKETKELGRLNAIDPSGNTYLRLRGMWGMKNPIKSFYKYVPLDFYRDNNFSLVFVVNNSKWKSFKNNKDFEKFVDNTDNLSIEDIKIQDPDNSNKSIDGKLIKYYK